jgi:hypothetical protein
MALDNSKRARIHQYKNETKNVTRELTVNEINMILEKNEKIFRTDLLRQQPIHSKEETFAGQRPYNA